LATRIRANYLEALEAEDFDVLGGEVYAKGFLRSYALFLGLDPVPLVEAYRQRYTVEPTPTARLQTMRDSGMLVTKQPRRRGWLPIGIVCVLIVLALGIWSLLAGRAELASAPTVATPETTLPPTTLGQAVTTSSTTTMPRDVTVDLKLDGRSWVSVSVDGARAFRGVLGKGAERSFTGKEKVDVELGNAGGVLLTVNGTFLGRAGEVGQGFERSFTVGEGAAPGADGSPTGTTTGAAPDDDDRIGGTTSGGLVTSPTSGVTGRRGRARERADQRETRRTVRKPTRTTKPSSDDDDEEEEDDKPRPRSPEAPDEQSPGRQGSGELSNDDASGGQIEG
jgi:cytoskeleton protein RodZ